MKPAREDMIASLTEGLEPVRAFNSRDGMGLLAIAAALTFAGVLMIKGFWVGILTGEASAFFWITNGLLALLGLASAGAVIAMASPRVGNRFDAPVWLSAMMVVLPISALLSSIPQQHGLGAIVNDIDGVHCLSHSLLSSVLIGAALTAWLRRGATVSPNAAGWFAGIAAGSLGTLVYGMSCSVVSITHLGIWHIAAVVISAILGRIIVPHLVRW